jgi:VWFA-related protein
MMRPFSVSLMCCAALVLAPVDGAFGQSAAQNTQPVPVFHTNANLVLVDVVVRQKGAPVHDLKASNFHLTEDGKAQKITVFEEHRATDVLEASKPPQLPPHVYTDTPRYAVTSAANVLLLDALNTPLADQVYVRRQMIKYLGTIPPGTRIAVFTLGSKLHIISGFTTDAAEIAKALGPGRGNAEKSPVMDPDFDDAMTQQLSLAQGAGVSSASIAAMQQFISDTQNFETQLREEMTIDALGQVARYLSTIPGRKNLIWFSASFPLRFLQGGSNPNMDPMADFSGQVKKAAELLALARVAVYPVDSRGLLNVPSVSAETNSSFATAMGSPPPQNTQGHGTAGAGGGGGNGGMGSFSQDQVASGASGSSLEAMGLASKDQTFLNDIAADHFNMDQIAQETGGEAFYNRNALGEVVGEAVANGSSYYTIGYDPGNQNYNGAVRKIDVHVEGGKYDLEFRHSYFADNPTAATKWIGGKTSPLINAMQHGTLPLSQVMFDVRVLPVTDPAVMAEPVTAGPAGDMAKNMKRAQRYMVDYWVDSRSLDHNALPNGKQQTQVEVTEVAYDDEGIRQNYADRGFSLDLTPQEAARNLQAGLALHEQIDLPPGKVYLRVGVHDLLSGRIGTVEVLVDVPK